MGKENQPTNNAFATAYSRLNDAQRLAVDTIEGPVMVIAGPGTGKTQILTLRIAKILLETQMQPENILALTFTESGAKAMRERLRQYVGALAYRVPIHTFHGFAGQLIAQYPDSYKNIVGGRPAGDIEKIKIFEAILDNPDFKILRPTNSPYHHIKSIRSIIGTLKQEYVTPDKLQDIIVTQEVVLADTEQLHEKGAHKGKVRGEYSKLEKTIEKNRELLLIYRQYQALLHEEKLFDFEDMLIDTVAALESNEDMLRDVQETYQYVLADEHQDVNGTQNTLLTLLVSYHDQPNIFAVGDEKQAIYRFQGASLENFLYFEDNFPGTNTIALTENYRSGQQVLDAAHSLVAVEEGPLAALRVPLRSALAQSSTVEVRDFSHQAVEDDWLVQTVKVDLEAGTIAEEIAVIVRTNAEVEQLASALRRAGIPAAASADGDILTHPITKHVVQLIAAAIDPSNEAALFGVLTAPYHKLTFADMALVASVRSYDWPLARLLGSEKRLKELQLESSAACTALHSMLTTAHSESGVKAPQHVVANLMESSGLLAHVTKNDPIDGGRVIRRLYDEIEALVISGEAVTLHDILRAFVTRQTYNVPLNAPYINADAHAVQVMTAHKSKGLEFDVVYMPHVVDSAWGGSKPRRTFDIPLTKIQTDESDQALDDEKRLLYVGMTRARTLLRLSSSRTNTAGKPLTPSRLLAELAADTFEVIATDEVEAAFLPTAALLATGSSSELDVACITKLFSQRGFSATSLNNYMRTPWDYLYRNVLRIPQVQGPALQYGTVVHNVLERTTKYHTNQQALPPLTLQKNWLETELGRLPLTTVEYTVMHEKAIATLVRYGEHLRTTLPVRSIEELKVSVTLETGLEECPEVILTGKLDRLDFAEDGSLMRVVDYKTGKPKTRNAIEGVTKSSDGGYKRQLVFYALLLELLDDERYQTRDMLLSFVEPGTGDKLVEEHFTVTDEEVASLKIEIIAAAKAIAAGTAWQEPCDPAVSDYCDLIPKA